MRLFRVVKSYFTSICIWKYSLINVLYGVNVVVLYLRYLPGILWKNRIFSLLNTAISSKNDLKNYCDFVCIIGKILYLCNVKVCIAGLPPPSL